MGKVKRISDDPAEIRHMVAELVEVERQTFAPEPDAREPDDETIPSSDILKALHRNEDGDADLFIRLHRGCFVYDCAAGNWYVWVDHHWKMDTTEQALAGVSEVADIYLKEMGRQSWARGGAEKAGQKDKAEKCKKLEDALAKRVRDLQTIRRKQAVLHLARAGADSLGISGEEWDKNPWLLAVKNGVINLKTGEFLTGEPKDFIKTAAPTEWKGLNEPCPEWEKFISDIFGSDEKLIAFIQRLLGYGITGLSILHIFVILYGLGRNGKGTLLEILRFVLGDYAFKTESELLLEQKFSRQAGAPNSGVLSLRGRRIVWASETSDGRRLNTGKLKELVGGDTLNARPVFGKHHIQFAPSHLLLLLTNSKPAAPASDYALWQRVHLIPFERAFVDDPKAPNESKADPYLSDKLKAEASGILAWLVKGCLTWQREELNPPDIVRAATEDYRKDEDILGYFIDERCTLGESLNVRAKIFYEKYKAWATENGLGELSGVRFGKEMKKRFNSDSDSEGIFYIGVSVEG